VLRHFRDFREAHLSETVLLLTGDYTQNRDRQRDCRRNTGYRKSGPGANNAATINAEVATRALDGR
jgi:hypothetical protein